MSNSRVEKTEGLIKHVHVTIPAQKVESAFEKKLKEVSPRIQEKGFRVGKVPMNLVKQKYGAQLRMEAIQDMLDDHLGEAMKSLDLKVSGIQGVEFIQTEAGKDVVLNAKFEVFPEIEVAHLDEVSIERVLSSVADADVDEMISTMQMQKAEWTIVERASKRQDRLEISFVGKMNGEPFNGGSSDSFQVVLGSGHMIAGFEEGLLDKKADEDVLLELTFPQDYGRADLAGQPVSFEVKVKSVSEPTLPPLDDAFAKQFQVDTYEKLRQEIRDNMARELEFAINSALKTALFESVLSKNAVEVPSSILTHEIQALKQQAAQQFKLPGGADAWKNLPDMLFTEQAKKRVQMSLLVEGMLEQFKITLDADRVEAMVRKLAAAYENADEAFAEIKADQQRFANIQQAILEDQLVDHLMTSVQVTDKSLSFKEAMKHLRSEHD